MTSLGLMGDPLAALGLDPSASPDWSPDNWLVSQVRLMPTPAAPVQGISTRNEPHTVPAPQGASLGIGASAGGGGVGAAIDQAMSWVGTMYDWGGNGVGGRGVDCSGLLFNAFGKAGFNMPRYRAVDYGRLGVAVDASAARAGDIVYFDEPGDTDHVGLYLGNGQFIESPHTGARVRVSSLKGRGGQIRRVLPESAFRGMPRDDAGNVNYFAPTGQTFVSGAAPGPQNDPLDILNGLNEGTDVHPLLGLPPDIQMGIAAQTPAAAPGSPAPTGADQFSKFLGAVSGQESGGDYSVENSVGAIGKYQVMYYNVGAWTQGALGRTLSPEQFRNSPAAQEAVARWRLGSLVAKYGYRGAAAAWYSGNASRHNDYTPLHNGSGPSVGDYVDEVLGGMG